MKLNTNQILSSVASLTYVDSHLLMEDAKFVKMLHSVCEYGKYSVAIEVLTSYVQDNY